MNIQEMYEKGKEMGLGEWDAYPYNNPQRLTMRELERRINEISMTDFGKSNFRGGAWSGD